MENNKGFSLVELLVVIAIIAIIGSVALPNLKSMLSANKILYKAQDIASFLRKGKNDAITIGKKTSIRFSSNTLELFHPFTEENTGPQNVGYDVFSDFDGFFFKSNLPVNTNLEFNNKGIPNMSAKFNLCFNDKDKSYAIQIDISQSGRVRISEIGKTIQKLSFSSCDTF